MAKQPLSENVKSLHKKLIPANIIICVIALVAGFCMLFLPWLDLRVSISGEGIASFVQTEDKDASNGGATLYADGDEDPMGDLMNELKTQLKGKTFEIPVNIYPFKMLGVATGEKADFEEFMNSSIGPDGAKKFAKDFATDVGSILINSAVNNAIDYVIEEAGKQLENIVNLQQYKNEAKAIVGALTSAQGTTVAQAKQDFDELIVKIASENGLTTQQVSEIQRISHDVIDQGADESGKFDILVLLKNIDFESLIPDNSGASGQVANGNASAIKPYAESSENPLASVIEIIENPASIVGENIDASTMETLKIVFLVMFIVLVAFPALMWFLLAIFSFVRIFTQRKIVKMWYVKLFCCWAGFFLIAANVALIFLPDLIGGTASTVLSAMNIIIVGSGAVTGVCWLLLILGSIFYYRRVKKKIKKTVREEQLALTEQPAV